VQKVKQNLTFCTHYHRERAECQEKLSRLPHLAWVITAEEVERTIQHILGEFTEG